MSNIIHKNSADSYGAISYFQKSRGSQGSPAVVVTGDMLGRLVASGYDGANYLEIGGIDINCEGTIASTRVPTRISFWTGTDAAPSVLTERMRIGSGGLIGINLTTTPGAQVQINTSGAAVKGQIIKLSASASANALEIQDSGAGILSYFDSGGRASLALYSAVNTAPNANVAFDINMSEAAVVGAGSNRYGIRTVHTTRITSADAAGSYFGAYIGLQISTSATKNYTGVVGGVRGVAQLIGNVTVAQMNGLDFQTINSSASGIITQARCINIEASNTGGGSIGTLYGLFLGNIDAATTNFAILTNAGNVVLNEGGDANTDFRVESDTYDALFVDASNDSIDIMHHASGKVGFFAATPVVQQAHIIDADGTLADITTKFNALLVKLENYGLLLTA